MMKPEFKHLIKQMGIKNIPFKYDNGILYIDNCKLYESDIFYKNKLYLFLPCIFYRKYKNYDGIPCLIHPCEISERYRFNNVIHIVLEI